MTVGDRLALLVATCATALVFLFLVLAPPLDDGERDVVGAVRSATSSTTMISSSTSTSTTFPPSSTVPSPSATVLPSTTVLAPPTPAAPPASGACGGWEDLIATYFPADQVGRACGVFIGCESEGDPNAVSDSNDHGLAQLHAGSDGFPGGWQAEFEQVTGVPFFNGVYDPALNLQFAAWLWDRSGWQPWSCAR